MKKTLIKLVLILSILGVTACGKNKTQETESITDMEIESSEDSEETTEVEESSEDSEETTEVDSDNTADSEETTEYEEEITEVDSGDNTDSEEVTESEEETTAVELNESSESTEDTNKLEFSKLEGTENTYHKDFVDKYLDSYKKSQVYIAVPDLNKPESLEKELELLIIQGHILDDSITYDEKNKLYTFKYADGSNGICDVMPDLDTGLNTNKVEDLYK